MWRWRKERVVRATSATNIQFDIDGNTYTCKSCEFVCNKKEKAVIHLIQKHDPLRGKYLESQKAWHSLFSADGACSLCDYRYSQRNTQGNSSISSKSAFALNKMRAGCLRTHLDFHHPEKRREVVNAAWDKAIKEANNTAVPEFKEAEADETANRVFASVPKEGYVCADCGLSFSSVPERLQHRNHAHPIAPSLTCSECGKVFSTATDRRKHRHRIKRKYLFPCPHCGRIFTTDAAKDAHMRECSQRPRNQYFRCPLCGKSFEAERLLKAHLAIKHQRTLLSASLKQIESMIEANRKGLKLEEEMHQSSVAPKTNGPTVRIASGWERVEPKQDSDVTDLNDMVNFAIVKDEVEDEDSFEDTTSDSNVPPLVKVEHEDGTTGGLSEMTVSISTCKEEIDNL